MAEHGGWRAPLARLGLDDSVRVSWAMYDWANSAFATTIMAAVLPIYYANVAGKHLVGDNTASAYWGYTTATALLLIALASPLMGAAADYLGAKRRFMAVFVGLGISFTAALWFVREGDWLLASIIFILANIGFAGANVFYDSLLPHIVDDARIDRLSASGYALGYLGGGLLLVVNLAWIMQPERFGMADASEASRWAMVSVALWWLVFSIPLFRNVPEPHPPQAGFRPSAGEVVRVSFGRLIATAREIRRYRDLGLFLLAFLIYNDGIGTIIKMATIYGDEIGIESKDLIGALVLTQFVGVPFAFAFGALARRIGVKRGIYVALVGYTLISVLGFFMREAWHFWALALAIATVQGGSQALSRSLFGSMVPRDKSSEFFGFFSVSAKFAGIAGPLIFAAVSQMAGSSRLSILSLIVFFLAGMALLTRVDVEAGQRAARAG
ncbi:MAG: MFS transporter [Caldilineae bacterium]|nr:MFS transporter [Chloroflexota bacterium]MCB9175598.1 MFS transporter [Caldilineae bacterium]